MIFVIRADLVSGMYMPENEVSRTIRIGGAASLDDLLWTIIGSIGFDNDHMYQFSLGRQAFSRKRSEVYSLDPGIGEHSTMEKLYSLPIRKGSRFWLVYDFGDDWTFSLKVEKILNESGNIRPSVIESVGTVEQYPNMDEWELEEDDMEEPELEPFEGGMDADLLVPHLSEIDADDMDLSSEYFDADYYTDEDSNPVLGRIMLRIVERQIAIGKPAFVKEGYEQLQEKGYIRKAAKIRLANALVQEIFEILKYNKDYDENRYKKFVQEIVSEPLDADKIPDLETGREHLISEGLVEFSELLMRNENNGAADRFSELWPDIRDWVDNNYTRMENRKLLRFTLEAIDESTDYRMGLHNALMDSGMAYLNSRRYEEGIKIQKEILASFSWENGADAETRDYIGTMLNNMGRHEEADKWFEDWYALSPDDPNCTNSYVASLQSRGESERAREVLEAHLPASPKPDEKYINLYTCAFNMYSAQGDKQKSAFYKRLLDRITRSEGQFSPVRSAGDWEDDSDLFSGDFPDQPVKKGKKIYPNDPCPCGSGKKYKKCCGRKAKGQEAR